MLAVQRTHKLRTDRDWLPPSVLRTSRLLRTGMVAGASAAVVGAVIAVPATLLLWKGLVLGGAGAAVAGDRAARTLLRRQVARMTRGEIELASVSARAEGELVVVRGTVQTEAPLRGVLVEREGIYRRMILKARGTWVHEAAVDFTLLDTAGNYILVQAAGARWIVPPRELVTYPATRFRGDHVPGELRQLTEGHSELLAFEQVLPVGANVQVIGYKTASADVTGDVVDYRLPPQRATLRSGPDLPLVITAIEDLER
ncbi:MAG: hypothetical protein SFX73_15050 [Kofleriaceae bacterium]|nr:hypothetical protein [Kofleriaceae bacterium]